MRFRWDANLPYRLGDDPKRHQSGCPKGEWSVGSDRDRLWATRTAGSRGRVSRHQADFMRYTIAALSVLATTLLIACERTGPTVHSFVSPSGNEVRLLGDLSSHPSVPFVENTVFIEVPGAPKKSLPRIYRADWFDDSFRDAYPSNEWLSDRVLRFNWAGGKTFARYPLLVRNTSDRQISVLLIGTGDSFVILELDPEIDLRIDVPYKANTYVSGLFADGSLLSEQVFSATHGAGRSLVIARDGARVEEGTSRPESGHSRGSLRLNRE
jgi:hypothetical protein